MNPSDIHCRPSRIVAVVDASQRSHQAVPVAAALGDRLAARVELQVDVTDPERRASIARSLATVHGDVAPSEAGTTAAAGDSLLVTGLRRRRPSDPDTATRQDRVHSWIAVGPGLRPLPDRRIEQLVVPLDGTPELDSLIGPAMAWVAAHGLLLRILGVVPDGPPPIRPHRPQTPHQRFADDPYAHVDGLVASRPTDGTDIKIDVVRDPIGLASALEHQLRHIPEATLLMPAWRPRGARSLTKRSSTRSVVRTCPVPVMLVRDATNPEQTT